MVVSFYSHSAVSTPSEDGKALLLLLLHKDSSNQFALARHRPVLSTSTSTGAHILAINVEEEKEK